MNWRLPMDRGARVTGIAAPGTRGSGTWPRPGAPHRMLRAGPDQRRPGRGFGPAPMIGGGSVGQRIPPLEENGCMLVRALFLRLLGAVYLVAFASLWVQGTRARRRRGDPARGGVPRARRVGARRRRLAAGADLLLAELRRRRSRHPVRTRNGSCHRPARGGGPRGRLGRVVGPVPVPVHGRPGIPGVPVGPAAARDRLPRHSLGPLRGGGRNGCGHPPRERCCGCCAGSSSG